MSDRVLFLALGASRARAVVDESARVVARAGEATVVVGDAAAWRGQTFEPGVRLVDLAALHRRHPPVAAERFLVHRAPQAALRAVGRGPVATWSRRAEKAYERRVAERFHRRVFQPLYRRLFSDADVRLLRRKVLRGGRFDLLVVADPTAIPVAARLAAEPDRFARISYALEAATDDAA
jgi:hypothetical protein